MPHSLDQNATCHTFHVELASYEMSWMSAVACPVWETSFATLDVSVGMYRPLHSHLFDVDCRVSWTTMFEFGP